MWDQQSESYIRLWRAVLDQLLQDLLYEGNVLKDGTSEELAKDEKVRKLYLGRNFEFF